MVCRKLHRSEVSLPAELTELAHDVEVWIEGRLPVIGGSIC